LNGNSAPDYLLNQGAHARVRLTDVVVLIESSNPVYVLHASGVNCEIGHAIVPPLECTGSKEISAARVDNGQFFLFIIVPSGHEDNFIVSGVDFEIDPSIFIDVPGTASYRVARISANFFPIEVPFRISNTTSGFHFGILNGDTGARYGYFSDFGSLRVSVSDEVICQGDFVDVSVKSTYSFLEWSPSVNTSELNFSLAPLQTTSYRLIASDTELCRDTALFSIKVNRSSESFDTIDVCRNDEIFIGNQRIAVSGFYSESYLTADNCDSVLHYQINFLDTLVSNEIMTLCPGESIFVFDDQEVSIPGIYFKTFTSASGCDSVHVIDLISDDELLYQDTIYLCTGESIELFGDIISETGIYNQSFASSRSCDSLQIFTVLPASPYNVSDTVYLCAGSSIKLNEEDINTGGIYTASYTSIQGCDSIQTYTVIEDDPSIYINWPGDLKMNFGKPLSWKIADDQSFIDTIIWNTLLGINCIHCTDWVFNPYSTTEYEVTIVTIGGCIETQRFTVEVIEEKPIYFPNTFSPNRDGINDFFTALTPEPGSIINWLHIYDRWGNRISTNDTFQPNDTNIGWDGMNNREPAMPGVYVYQAQVTFQDGKVFIYTGDVTLIR
jgi:gliding motility-associated-like protein